MDGVIRIPLAEFSAVGDHPYGVTTSAGPRGVTTLRWFVAGPENALTCAAAEAIVAHDAALGPIVLCGPSGVGKSHLAWGLAARCEQSAGERRSVNSGERRSVSSTCIASVHIVAAADITSDETTAPRPEAMRPGRSAAGNRPQPAADLDLLIVEDVGDLRDRPIAQQQLTHHLDEVAARGGLVVVTSREPPGESRALMPTLRSRLVGGLVVPMAMPGLAARRALLADWAALLGVSLAEEAADLLAAGLELSPPQLRGAVVTLACATNGHVDESLRDSTLRLGETRPRGASGRSATIDPAAARSYVATHGTTGEVSLRTVAAKTARYFGLTLADLKSSSRHRNVVEARAVAMYLARRMTGLSLERIGAYFGGRDHTTVLHNCHRTEELQATDAVTRHAVTALEDALKRSSRSSASRERAAHEKSRGRKHRRKYCGKPVAGLALSGV